MSEKEEKDNSSNKEKEGVNHFKREIVLVGNKNACGFCRSGHEDLSKAAKKNPNIIYKYIPIESEEATEILEAEGVEPEVDEEGREIYPMPFIKDCKVDVKTGEVVKNSCRKIEGYKKDDWDDLDDDISLD